MDSTAMPELNKRQHHLLVVVALGILLFGAVFATLAVLKTFGSSSANSVVTTAPVTPQFTTQVVLNGLNRPWDVTFLPTREVLFTQRSGTVNIVKGTTYTQLATINDVRAVGEGGLMSMAADPLFIANRFIYTCYNTSTDIRVVRWKTNQNLTQLSDKTPIVTGMPVNPSGRHSGCRMAFGPDGYLWIGTGDTGLAWRNPQAPQDPKSLGGKILRVDREGKAANGNLGAPFDSRIYSYGHRNTQGIAFPLIPYGGIIGYSAEHGSNVDDEINVLKKGNFGWDPDIAYTEQGVPMTDKKKFPNAIDASWKSGVPTQAPSGLAAINGAQWKSWNGTLAMAMLKAKHLKILTLDYQGKIVKEEKILQDKGRLRDVEQAPDKSIYVTTDNGGDNDQLIRLIPKE